MTEKYLPYIDPEKLDAAIASANDHAIFELLTDPLHEELYRRQDFNFMDMLSEGQQLLLSYDYLLQQVGQGGFIQFLANGYIGLLPEMPGWLQSVGALDMAMVIDDVIKVYVLNIDLFKKEMTTQQFAQLYDELKEFELLEQRFNALNEKTISMMMAYARQHIEDFVAGTP